MKKKSGRAKPKKRPVESQMDGPFITEKHDCILFKRNGTAWKWSEGGTIQRYPRIGERVVVAYSQTQFSHTEPILEVISIDEQVDDMTVVFQDKDSVWQLIFPAHSNNLSEIRKQLKRKSK